MLKSAKRVLYLIFAFTLIGVLYYLKNSAAFEKRMDWIEHLYKLENVPTLVNESSKQSSVDAMTLVNKWTKPSRDDDMEIHEQRIHIFNETGEFVNADCVPLSVSGFRYRTRICIYNTSDDMYVSGSLRGHGAWEANILRGFGAQLQAHPDSIFLDVGSQVGTFTMQATALGHEVIAIDPLRTNLQLLSKSLRLAHQEGNVTLLWNAVSNVYESVWLRVERKNIGSTHIVKEGGKGLPNSVSAADYSVTTILLDDLVDEFQIKNKTIIMKMDIEGSEFIALLGANKLLRYNKVCYVSAELTFAKKRGTLRPIVELMKSYGFDFFADPSLTRNIANNPMSVGGEGFFRDNKCI